MSAKIEKIRVICLTDQTKQFNHFDGSFQNVLVIVYADNGLYGMGESDSPPHLIKELITMKAYNFKSLGLAEILIGEPLDSPQRLWQLMYDKTTWHGRNGLTIHAISALDMAIWDLFAKLQNKSLCHSIGSVEHHKLPAYATLYNIDSNQKLEQSVTQTLDKGFKYIKICVEPWWTDIDSAKKFLILLRELVGKEIHLMLDCAHEFTELVQLDPFLDLLQTLNFSWLEAPLPLDDLEGHKQLKMKTNIPIGVGDLGSTTCKEFEPFFNNHCLDIAQPDISLFGGLSESIKLKELIETSENKKQRNIRIIPHGYNSDITLALNVSFCACQKLLVPMEFSASPSSLRQFLVKNPVQVDEQGMIAVNTNNAGLGLSLNWQIIDELKEEDIILD